MSIFEKYSDERRFLGRVAVGSAGILLGRISFFDEGYTEGSILCVCEDDYVDRATLLLCPPIALIVICSERAETLGELCTLGVPCIVVEEERLGRECKNKVALIDTERGILTLDPSIDTLNFYSAEKGRGGSYDIGCEVGYALKRSDESVRRLGVEHFFVRSELLCASEGGFFENAVGLWEQGCPEQLMINMKVPRDNDGDARGFAECIEELFRASLYGSFALSISDFDCEEELSHALKIFHKAFCLLEAEGREFNGYIPRGIMLSSPLWLMRASPVTNPDFIMLDIDRLLPSLFCLDAETVIKKEKVLQKELFSLLERYFINFMPRCDLLVKSEAFFGTRLLQNLVAFADIKLVYR